MIGSKLGINVRFGLYCGQFAVALPFVAVLSIQPAAAQNFTVTSGTTVGDQTMKNSGDTGIIENGGSVIGTQDQFFQTAAVQMANSDQSLNNGGSISTIANSYLGVLSLGDNAEITNSGTISTLGAASHGIVASGYNAPKATIINSGSITTTGENAIGISVDSNSSIHNSGRIESFGGGGIGINSWGDNVTILNSGSIVLWNNGSHGIRSLNHNTSISNSGIINLVGYSGRGIDLRSSAAVNSGTITVIGDSGSGIYSIGKNSSITNTGTIGAAGRDSSGINISTYSENTSIANSGTIEVIGVDAIGIRASGLDTSITNSGHVISQHSSAIRLFSSQKNTLTLLPGSVLQGEVIMAGNTNTLNVGNGLSIATIFNEAPDVINTGGAPSAVSGSLVAVVDPTSLSTDDESLADLTGGVFSAVQTRLDSLRQDDTRKTETFGNSYTRSSTDHESQFWMQGFGSYRKQRSSGVSTGTHQRLAGFVAGLDGNAFDDTQVGVFLGTSVGDVKSSYGSQETASRSVYGGAYASRSWTGINFDIAFAGGYSFYDRKREVANNLVAGGLETAVSDYGGWFFSPEVTLTGPVFPSTTPLEAHVAVRYAGLFMDNFVETGTSGGIAVGRRDVHIGVARTGLALPLEKLHEDGALSRIRVTGGIEARSQFGDQTVAGSLLGQSIIFDPGGDSNVVSGFAGLTGEYSTPSGIEFFATLEGQLENTGSQHGSIWAGFKKSF